MGATSVHNSGMSGFGLLRFEPKRIYVIAEAGLNHEGSRERALALVHAARWAGADAIKFQTFRLERVADTHPSRTFAGQGLKLQTEFRNPELSYDTLRAVSREARRLEIDLLATPFDEESADLLDRLGSRAFKIESNIAQRTWVKYVSRKGKPVLLSTEMNSIEEIRSALDWMHQENNDQVVLMHGVSAYPASSEELNLKIIHQLREQFATTVGFTDNSSGGLAAITAVSLGAQIIDRHLGIDNRCSAQALSVSMEPKRFKTHIEELRRVGVLLRARDPQVARHHTARLAAAAQ